MWQECILQRSKALKAQRNPDRQRQTPSSKPLVKSTRPERRCPWARKMWKPSKSRNWKKAAVKQKSEDNCHDSQIGSGGRLLSGWVLVSINFLQHDPTAIHIHGTAGNPRGCIAC